MIPDGDRPTGAVLVVYVLASWLLALFILGVWLKW